MFVAFRVESGDDSKAVAGLLSQVIGNIQTAKGCCTLRRAGGVAVHVSPGDPICQGDVIETAADGRVGIRFIDGTVFNLFPGTCITLNEFVCDTSGASHSLLFGVTSGTFAFMAGRVAETRCLTVDTPVGSIRGRAHSSGIGMVSLASLIFSMIGEAFAADPDVAILQDDRITYKDLDHGAFELITKEAIPKYILVEDPEKTIVLHQQQRGSSVSVNQVTNSAARMEELQTAQQEVLANFAKGPVGSSTPPFVGPLPVQPINFIQTDAPSEFKSLEALYTPIIIHEIFLRPLPTLSVPAGPIEIDTAVFDAFKAKSGTFAASSIRSDATLTFGVSGGTAGSTVLSGTTYDLSKTGSYGTLYVNSTTGAFIFVPESGAINALKAPTTESFIITVSDGSLSVNQTFSITFNGTNDVAIISGTAAGSVIEAGGVANAAPGTPTATGTLTDIDVDDPPNTFTAITSPTASAGGYGSVAMTAAGAWTYTLDNANSAVQALNAGGILTDSFTVTTVDGTPQVVTITINGSNDDAIISGTTAGSVTEIRGVVNATPGTETATGTLTDTDLDNPPNTFTAVSLPGGYGTFTMTAAGVWTYTLDDTNSAVQALNVGDTRTDTFTVSSIDGTPQMVTITIHGPLIGATGTAPSLTLSESHLTATALDDNMAGSAPNASLTTTSGNFSTAFTSVQGVDGATISYALSIAGGSGTASGLIDSHTGQADVLVLNGNAIEGHVGSTDGALAFTIQLDLTTGVVTFTEYRAVTQPFGTNPDGGEGVSLTAGIVNLTATITETDGDFQTASIDLGKQLTILDDGPTITASGSAPTPTVDESFLTAATNGINGSTPNLANTQTTGNFSTAFTPVQGADSATIAYALSITGGDGTASGLLDAQTGLSDVLVLNGNTIEGHVGNAAGALAFTITLDPNTGIVTFTEDRSVKEATASNPDTSEGISLTAGIVNLTATITDKDGDFQTASIDLGKQLTIQDDGPTITASGSGPTLKVDESFLTAATNGINGSTPNLANTQTTGDFSTAFTSLQGADSATVAYALSITGGDGTASGLLDAQTGLSDVLVLNGNTIEGRVGNAAGALAFTITLDPNTGIVTFTEDRSVKEATASNPDTSEGISLTAGIVHLTAAITDKDGDFQAASIDLGKQLTIQDDGPTIGGFGEISIVAQNNQRATANFNVIFGADGDGAMRVAIRDGTVNGYNLATTDLGGGITSVHVTGNGDDYTFYYGTHAVSGGVELDAFFTNTSGTLSNAFFTLLINPDGNYTFDIESVGLLQQRTVTGSDFGASSSGQSSLISPDGHLIITGDFNGAPADIKASSNGIAVGDTGLQMDQHETLLLKFTQEQTDVSFILTQWQGNGTADAVFHVRDGSTAIHDFNINIPKPSGDARIVVEMTSNLALVNTQTFDGATSTYTLYVGSEFDQIGVSYDHAVTGNTTFTINNITYDERTIPSTDLLFDVIAVDGDGDSSMASLQVHLLGGTSAASSFASSSTPTADALVGDSGNATLTGPFMASPISGSAQAVTTTNAAAIMSSSTTDFVLEAGGASPGTPTATGTLTATGVDNLFSAFTPVSSPTPSASGYGSFTMTAAGMWIYMLDNANSAVENLNNCDTLTDSFTVATVDGATQVVTVTIHGASDADPNDHNDLTLGTQVGTIYGGSGNDTISGSNGNETIIGGFGADQLTGSNGDDRFAYWFLADSRTSRFDTISDFISGSDKIDLTRLGALAFATLALTPTSTSVPAHTIAWLYDSTCNETIVYVNPTDQTLSIGNSGLLEIHLQGIATVEASDFDFVAAVVATAAASGEPLNLELAATAETEGAVIAMSTADGPSEAIVDDADATVQTSDVGFSLNADRDPLVSGHARIVSFGEDLSKPTEETEISAVITPENGQPVVPHHVHITWPAESRFAFDSAPALNSASAMPAHDVMMHPSVAIQLAAIATPHAAGDIAELQVNVHKHEPEGGGGNAPTHSHGNNGSRANSTVALGDGDLEVPEVSGNHGQVVASLVANAWEPPAHANNHSTQDDPSEHGADPSHGANAHGTSGSRAAVKPGLGDSFQFNHAIAGSEREGENAPSHSHGKNASIPSDAGEQGAAQLHGAPSSDPHEMASSADVGKHVLGDSFHFNHAIAGSESSGIVELASLDLAPASTGRHANAAENSQPGESQTIELSLPGNAVDHFQGHPGNTHAHHELMV